MYEESGNLEARSDVLLGDMASSNPPWTDCKSIGQPWPSRLFSRPILFG